MHERVGRERTKWLLPQRLAATHLAVAGSGRLGWTGALPAAESAARRAVRGHK